MWEPASVADFKALNSILDGILKKTTRISVKIAAPQPGFE
jgi:hypothetical protein